MDKPSKSEIGRNFFCRHFGTIFSKSDKISTFFPALGQAFLLHFFFFSPSCSHFRPKNRKETKKFEIGQLLSDTYIYIGQTLSDLRFFEKIKWETSDFKKYQENRAKSRFAIRGSSGPTPVARGGSGAKALSLAARQTQHRILIDICTPMGSFEWIEEGDQSPHLSLSLCKNLSLSMLSFCFFFSLPLALYLYLPPPFPPSTPRTLSPFPPPSPPPQPHPLSPCLLPPSPCTSPCLVCGERTFIGFNLWKLKPTNNNGQVLNWKMWPVAQYVNFNFIPPELQLLYMNVVALFWTIGLSMIMN